RRPSVDAPLAPPRLLEHGLEAGAGNVVESPLSASDLSLDASPLRFGLITDECCEEQDDRQRSDHHQRQHDDQEPGHHFTRLTVSLTTSAMARAVRSPSP